MVRSHTRELLAPPPLRNACDRCHTQKLRCLKAPQGDTCLRCAKFGARCIFSARTPRRRMRPQFSDDKAHGEPEAVAPSIIEQTLSRPDFMAAATPANHLPQPSLFMDMEHFHSSTTDLFALPDFTGTSTEHQLWDFQEPPLLLDETPQTMANAVRELADLNVRLLDHAATLPPPLNSSYPQALPLGKLFAIDQTFTLTKSLIAILKGLSTGLGQNCANDGSIDRATVFLFLSCYYRLADIYESIFVHMRTCAQDPHHPTPEQEVVTLPLLQIGSYIPTQMPNTVSGSPPPISAFSMHMIMVLILSTHLCEQLRDVIAIGIRCAQSGNLVLQTVETGFDQDSLHSNVGNLEGGSEGSDFNEMGWKAMWKRSNELSELMRLAKQVIMRFSLASL
ncbi:hypothetical protein BCR34DRAFT_566736 [Clohesyomyces aquaticus]|uniref:Zn(2)-C6 fungal-type domain-containing protein n=1 Tax=Clohesyomyces aquaticus TaxID=1231657 RepID=A0A1Y1ZJP5_9PLEO|nr:hypothetical protein BCR34DRAFT_566736 [Clohesyomyces aquaticus]